MLDDHHQQRMQALDQFSIDPQGATLTFVQRLCRENGWSVPYAERVVREYKRFAFLAVEAGHPVTPSEDVDQAWHLHLAYTRNYWHEFCAILGKPLHLCHFSDAPFEFGVEVEIGVLRFFGAAHGFFQRLDV